MTLAPYQRAQNYFRTFPDWPMPRADERWLDGMWVMGNNYRTPARNVDGTPYYGAYPPGYVKRVMALFPDAQRVLHLFAGSLPVAGARMNDDASGAIPDYTRFGNTLAGPKNLWGPLDSEGDAHELSKYYDPGVFDLILADPPYSKEDAARYGMPMVDRRKVLRQVYEVLAPGGNLVWLDTVLPMFRADMFRLWGLIGITRSTNHRYRQVAIFERRPNEARLKQQSLLEVPIPSEFTEEGGADITEAV